MNDNELREKVWRFAKYCNDLSPWKLNDPKDPIVEAAINDFADDLKKAIRQTNISQIENWRDWIKPNPELQWLVKEMDKAIITLKDETLTDCNGVYLEALKSGGEE